MTWGEVKRIEQMLFQQLDRESYVKFEQKMGIWSRLEISLPTFKGKRCERAKLTETVLGTILAESDYKNLKEVENGLHVILKEYLLLQQDMKKTDFRRKEYEKVGKWVREFWDRYDQID